MALLADAPGHAVVLENLGGRPVERVLIEGVCQVENLIVVEARQVEVRWLRCARSN